MIVLDASALVELAARRSIAGWVLDQLEGETVAAPAHQLAEVVSALARLERAGALALDVGAAIDHAVTLPQVVHDIDGDLVRRAWALRDRVRVVDGLYVALAVRLDADLVTTDRRLARADPPCRVTTPHARDAVMTERATGGTR